MSADTRWRSRIVGHAEVDPAALTPNARNWRLHPTGQRQALTEVLDQVGWVQDVVVNRRSGHLVDGHLRVELAMEQGVKTVPVVYVDLSDAEEVLVLATLDPLAALATGDSEQLAALLGEVQYEGSGLAAMLDALARDTGLNDPPTGLTDPDDVPVLAEQPYVQRGEVYWLGGHRVMCGDATDAADVARLLGGAAPTLMVTDPPYGVAYDPSWRAAAGVNRSRRRLGTVTNDDRADWREAWALFSGDVAYVWHGGLHSSEVAASLVAVGFDLRTQLVWAKDRFALSRGHYHWQHEPCWYAVRHGATAHWTGDRSQPTVWSIPARDDAGHGHSTQKPVECMERPLRNHAGDVYDPFLGSGTTLIAAERQGRRCYGLEIEPRYVQVAVERWEAYTGATATREVPRG